MGTSETEGPHALEEPLRLEADAEELSALVGPGDANRRLVESLLGVRVSLRDGAVWVQEAGDDSAAAMVVLEGLLNAIRSGRGVSTADVRYAVSHARRGGGDVGNLLSQHIVVSHRGRPVTPKTPGQLRYVEAISEHDLTFCIGPAGTGKTYLAMAMAVAALRDEAVSRIVLTRPAVEAGERLGFLPGDLAQKVDPYLRPLYDALYDLMGFDKVAKLFERQAIEIAPLAYMRGRTLNHAFIILDEAQNTTPEQMKMFLTRIGFGTRAVITGDVTQIDLARGSKSGLIEADRVLKGVRGIAFCRFTSADVVRHPLVQKIIDAYDRGGERSGVDEIYLVYNRFVSMMTQTPETVRLLPLEVVEAEDGPPPPPTPKTAVEPDPAKAEFEIRWPNVVRIDRVFQPTLVLDWDKAQTLALDAAQTAQVAELAPILEGKPDVTRVDSIDLQRLAAEFRTQRIIFEAARDLYDQMEHNWRGSRELLLAQLVRLVEQFIRSDKIAISPPLFYQDELRRRLIVTLNMTRVVQHIWEAIRFENTERLEPVFDRDHPIRSTGDMVPWWTGKPCERTKRSHVNFCVYDSTWEASDAYVLDHDPRVAAWVKNDHLGFEVFYVHRGVVRKYRPDFLVRLAGGDMLVLETKGQDTEEDRVKRRFLDEWLAAVNAHGGFGQWRGAVALRPGEIRDILARENH